MNTPRYILRLQELIAEGRVTPNGIQNITIRHDDDCAIFRELECDCEYELVLPDGEIVRQG